VAIRDGLAFGGCAADGCGSLAFVARVLAASVLIFWVFVSFSPLGYAFYGQCQRPLPGVH